MAAGYTEDSYEQTLMELFENLGYTRLYGPDVERDYECPIYEDELRAALKRLNPTLPADALHDAFGKLRSFENGELVQKNRVFTDYLQTGVPVRYVVKGEERSGIA